MAAVVLVHGLYHRPEHFDLVAERLRTEGIEVTVPELHRGSLPAHTAAVQAAIDKLREPPIVFGHSYGGSVITGVRGAGHLVYLAAFVPDTGESAASLGGLSPQLLGAIRPEVSGSTSLHPDRAVNPLYGDCPEPLAAWAVGLLRVQSPRLRARNPEALRLEAHSLHLRRLRTGPGHRPGPAAADGLALRRHARVAHGPFSVRRKARPRR